MSIKIANIADAESAPEGRDRISWARGFMPAVKDAREEFIASGELRGRRIGVVLTLEPKTACLAASLKEAGAEVSVFCDAAYTTDSVAAGLESLGVKVYARSDADKETELVLLNRFLDDEIEYLIDDGAHVTRYIHTERRDALKTLKGVAEETTSGLRPLRVMEKEGALEVPCMAVNDAKTKVLFDNVYGTGQSVVTTLIDLTNTQLQGKSVVVVGYGFVGRGIALSAHAFGARVSVVEIDPVRALQALHEGHSVSSLEELCPTADVFFTATGIGYTLNGDHMRLMKDGAIVSVGGAGPPEVDLGGNQPVQRGDFARDGVRAIPIDANRTVFLIADGDCSNVGAAEGNPIEIMDLSLAVQMRAIGYLVENSATLSVGVLPIPPEIDTRVSMSVLRAKGAVLDEPSPEQIRHANSWLDDNPVEEEGAGEAEE